jgi:4-amino-4-deoxy-L-arabinose transferase-like glycosyltransferase
MTRKMGTEGARGTKSSLFHPALIGLVLAAIVVRIVITLVLPRVIKFDESAYLMLGYNLVNGSGYTTTQMYPDTHHPPLYPIISGLVHWFVGDFEQASNLAYALFGGLLLLPVFVLAQRVYGSQTAWLVAILLAIFPPLSISVLYWGGMTEPLFLFLLYGGLAALLVAFEDNRAAMLTSGGLLLGLAYLTRPEAIVYFGVILLFGLVWLRNRPPCSGFLNRYAFAWSILVFVLVAAPYVWYLHSHTGQWTLSGKTNGTVQSFDDMLAGDWAAFDRSNWGLDSSGKVVNWDSPERFKGSLLREVVLADPVHFLHRVLLNGYRLKEELFVKDVFWYGLLPLVALAFFKDPWDRKRLMHEAFLITIILVLLLVFLPFGIFVRYFAPAFPVLLMWTARGALGLGAWLLETLELLRGRPASGRYLRFMLSWMPAAMVVLFLVIMVPVAAQGHLERLLLGEKKAGLWLREHSAVDAAIMSRDIAVGLYANRRYVPSPNSDWPRMLQYARSYGASYLVASSGELTRLRPQLAFLLGSGTPELELVYSFEESRGRTLVFRILPSSKSSLIAGQPFLGEPIPSTKPAGLKH